MSSHLFFWILSFAELIFIIFLVLALLITFKYRFTPSWHTSYFAMRILKGTLTEGILCSGQPYISCVLLSESHQLSGTLSKTLSYSVVMEQFPWTSISCILCNKPIFRLMCRLSHSEPGGNIGDVSFVPLCPFFYAHNVISTWEVNAVAFHTC